MKASFFAVGRNALLGLLLALAAPLRAQPASSALPVIRVETELEVGRLPAAIRYNDAEGLPGPTGPADGGYTYDRFDRLDSAGLTWRRRRYAVGTGRLLLDIYSSGMLPGMVLQGASREWYESGQLREEITYRDNVLTGEFRTWHPNGQLRRREVRAAGQPGVVPSRACYDAAGQPLAKCPPYHTFAYLPGLEGAKADFYRRLKQGYAAKLPAGYRQAQRQFVYYAFRIDSTGRVRAPRIVTTDPGWIPAAAAPALQDAILRTILELPVFAPATLEGQPYSDWVVGSIDTRAR